MGWLGKLVSGINPWTAGLSVAGGLAGMLAGKSKAAEAARVEKMNREMANLDTKFSPLVASKAYQQAVPDAGPGAAGGLFSGALSGFQQGQSIGKSNLANKLKESEIKGQNLYNDMLASQVAPAPIANKARYGLGVNLAPWDK